MNHKSNWDLNKEVMINQALVDYKDKDCPSAGFNIIRYTYKGAISVKSEFNELAGQMFTEWVTKCGPDANTKYVVLRLAKLGGLEWNGV